MSSLIGSALVPRVTHVTGRVRVPGDKSISHRYAMLAAIAEGTSRLRGYAPGADCAATLACLEALGVPIRRVRDGSPPAPRRSSSRDAAREAFAPRPGRSTRPTPARRCGCSRGCSPRIRSAPCSSATRRCRGGPMRRVIDPLTRMGATITAVEGRPPLTIDGTSLHGISHQPEVPSAQIKSAVLLAGLHAAGRTTVLEPAPTRDHTERALQAFGGSAIRDGLSVSVDGGQRLRRDRRRYSGRHFVGRLLARAGRGDPGSDLVIEGVGLNPTRAARARGPPAGGGRDRDSPRLSD